MQENVLGFRNFMFV